VGEPSSRCGRAGAGADLESFGRFADAHPLLKTPVPTGFQGRFEIPGGFVIELAEFSEEGRQYLNPDPAKFGFD
jgi:hypothetical protein